MDFTTAYDLMIIKFHFKKEEDNLVTFRSVSTKTQIDCFLISVNNRMLCKDFKVTPGEYLGTQHRLLVMDVVIKSSKIKKRSVEDPRVRWWNLISENATKLSVKIKVEGS